MSALDRALAAQARTAIGSTRTRLQWWALSYRGVQSRFNTMATPPVVTIGGANATVNANTGYTVSAGWNGGRITLPGPLTFAQDATNTARGTAFVTTQGDGSFIQGPLTRMRFVTDAPVFEAVYRGNADRLNLIVDGEIAFRARGVVELPADTVAHQVKVSFGADATSYYLATVTSNQNGSGYALGDTITLAGGTASAAATVTVTAIGSGGKVSTVAVTTPGTYSAVTAGTMTQAATSGAGSGATFGGAVFAKHATVRRLRRIELISDGQSPLVGLNVGPTDTVLPYPVSARVPRLLILGDSQQNTYVDYAGGTMGATIAQMLGLWDSLVITQRGGTGWLTPNTPALPWSDARRIADIVAQAPDIVLIVGSQNDGVQTASALTAAVTATLNTLLAALPKTLFVGIGPVTGNSTALQAAIAAGWAAASDQTRVRFIDNYAASGTLAWIGGTGRAGAETGSGSADNYVSTDNTHLHEDGNQFWAAIAAVRVGDALLGMIR